KTAPAVSLFRPEIVLATSITAAPARRAVVLAEPGARPDALRTQFGTAQSVLAGLDDARQTLGAAAADTRTRAPAATSPRARWVSPTRPYSSSARRASWRPARRARSARRR